MKTCPRYCVIEKRLGETPLQATERLREQLDLAPSIPIAYAGRLDPMATGKLLVLIGDECKRQQHYHDLDKGYEFEVLFGVKSDTGDVLGIVETCAAPLLSIRDMEAAAATFIGQITLPYPHFSAKTVRGKPLHTWALEGRLGEIEIPERLSRIYSLKVCGIKTLSRETLAETVRIKINSFPEVTDPRKMLGRDFRRTDVRQSWNALFSHTPTTAYQVATLHCVSSSGTYMRSLAAAIATRFGTCGLALGIHRFRIGRYRPLIGRYGFWTQSFS